jgi:hypothetical protein
VTPRCESQKGESSVVTDDRQTTYTVDEIRTALGIEPPGPLPTELWGRLRFAGWRDGKKVWRLKTEGRAC